MKKTFVFKKIFWALVNIKSPSVIPYLKTWQEYENPEQNLLVVTINYDKFLSRNIKEIKKGLEYPCGELFLNKCREITKFNKIPLLDVITTDDDHLCSQQFVSDILLGGKLYIKNDGTDISALDKLCDVLREYKDVIVINSSADLRDLDKFEKILLMAKSNRKSFPGYFVAGVNANSSISPAFPFRLSRNNPHVITNFFYTQGPIICHVLLQTRKSFFPAYFGGVKNKFVAIRYFEIMLSKFVLSIGGDILYLENDRLLSYLAGRHNWPVSDSRLDKIL